METAVPSPLENESMYFSDMKPGTKLPGAFAHRDDANVLLKKLTK